MIVGVAGPLRSGKDTFSNRLISAHGFTRVSFADALKEEVATRLRRTVKAHLKSVGRWPKDSDSLHDESKWDELIHDLLWVNRDEFARTLLQEYGTEVRRTDDANYWVWRWEEKIVKMGGNTGRVVVPDMRFRNEALMISSWGGTLVKISPRQDQPPVAVDVNAHASERDLDIWNTWHFIAKNTGGVKELETEADEFAATFVK